MDDALSPPAEPEAVADSTPSLPLELVHHIIKLGLPPVRFDTFPERYKLLSTFALVSKSWSSLAQAELWKHIHFEDEKGRDVLVGAIDASRTVGRLARSLRLGCSEGTYWTMAVVEALLGTFVGCEEVWLCRDTENVESDSLIGDPSFASHLTRLHLDVLTFDPSRTVDIIFPALVELSISDPAANVPVALNFLTNTQFPALRSFLLIDWYHLDLSEHRQPMNAAVRHVASGLERFGFLVDREGDSQPPDLDWTGFTSLDTLLLPLVGDSLATVRQLPSKIKTLRLTPGVDDSYAWSESLIEMLKGWPDALSSLQRLVLPSALGSYQMAEVAQVCAERPVAVEYRTVAAGSDTVYWDTWEDFVLYPW